MHKESPFRVKLPIERGVFLFRSTGADIIMPQKINSGISIKKTSFFYILDLPKQLTKSALFYLNVTPDYLRLYSVPSTISIAGRNVQSSTDILGF